MNFKYNFEQHEILKKGCIASYAGNKNELPPEYKLIKESKPSKTGFYACAYQKGDEIIIIYRGTDELLGPDGKNDAQLITRRLPDQEKEALAFYNEVKAEHKNAKFYITGHSLGGALAQFIGAITGHPTVTFNGVGVASIIRREYKGYHTDNIVNYIVPGDRFVEWSNSNHLGTCYEVESNARFDKHKLERLKPLSTAKVISNVKEYRSMHEKFDAYTNRWVQGAREIKHSIKTPIFNQSSYCPGSYYVNEYKRDDGTIVSGYVRTCGIHNPEPAVKKRFNEMTRQDVLEILERYI